MLEARTTTTKVVRRGVGCTQRFGTVAGMDDRYRELLRTTTTTSLLEGLFNPDDDVVWQAFDLRYRPIITGVARRLGVSGSDADDVAQETLIQFVRDYRAGRYQKERGRLRGWVVGIARHRVIDMQRARGRRKEVPGATAMERMPQDNEMEKLWDEELDRSILRQAVEELRRTTKTSEKSISAFEQVVFDRRSVNAVAEDLGMTPHDIYVSRSRITTRLREIAERLRNLYEAD